jgi:hypothetical protein
MATYLESRPFPRASQAVSRFTVLYLIRRPTRQLADWGADFKEIDS